MPQGLLPSHFSSEHPHQRYLDNKPSFLTRLKRRFFYVLDGNPRRLKSISLLLLTVCIAFYLVFFVFVNDAVIEEAPNIVLPDSLLEKRVDFKRVTIDKICSESTSVCYSVIDEKTDENTVLRHLSFDNGLPEEYDTSVILIPPSGETFDSSDTRIWNIDHRKISSQYVAGMFITPFMLSLLPTEGPAGNKSMLEIGLGGGSLDMAMHTALPDVNITGVELDPVVIKIAEKWFGVAGNDRHRMVAADGVQFVSDMRKRQETTDIVVVDACGGDVDITCPPEGFRTRDAVENLMSILNPSGILIVNVLAHDEKEANPVNVQKAVAAYTDVFPACLQLKMTNELNVILACLTQSIGDVEEQLKFYSKRLDAAVTTFKLEYILGNVSLSKTY